MQYTQKKIDDNLKNILDSLAVISGAAVDNLNARAARMTIEQKKNPIIARKICDLIASGYSNSEAFVMAALAFDCSLDRVRAVYCAHKNATRQRVAFAKNFMIHTLRRRGFKINDIALILGCSRQTVFNYSNKDFFC